MTNAQDVSLAFDAGNTKILSPDAKNSLNLDSPVIQRKRFQANNDAKATLAKTTSLDAEKVENKPSLIPLTKNDAQPQQVPGNHSPIGISFLWFFLVTCPTNTK